MIMITKNHTFIYYFHFSTIKWKLLINTTQTIFSNNLKIIEISTIN